MHNTNTAILHPSLPTGTGLRQVAEGKVRNIYAHEALPHSLIFVTSDRISAFDVVFNEGILNKGKVLTQVSSFWAERIEAAKPFHLICDDIDDAQFSSLGLSNAQRDQLRGRTMMVQKLNMSPVECVVRGYLVGSGYKEYMSTGKLCGHDLPAGMQLGDAFDTPLFTPATKAEIGDHDENISYERMVDIVGETDAAELRTRSFALYNEARDFAAQHGLILVDTKFEFGKNPNNVLVLADEILTPDSSRYWDADEATATPRGTTPPSFDKQIVRNYLETLDWNKQAPPPALPAEIVERTAARYIELAARLGCVVK